MKRSLAVFASLLFLAGAGMVWADSSSPITHIKHLRHHHKSKKSKPKNELNPQPMPPGAKAPTGQGSNGQANKAQ
jgi:hypothetical protein